jgi:N-carbamoylputrescine amidase
MTVKVATTQFASSINVEENIKNAEKLVRAAARDGAQIVLLQELFETVYFCQEQNQKYFEVAQHKDNYMIRHFSRLAEELNVVIPVSFFERDNNSYYNSVTIIDAGGEIVGHYRKSHIPTGPGYEEKFYFSPGDTGIKAVQTKFAKIAVLICWDSWFPEAARTAVLDGAEIVFYPSAIGSEPNDPSYDSHPHWATVIRGNSGANMVPTVTSNRIGTETCGESEITFFGGSFITDHLGNVVKQLSKTDESYAIAEFDLESIRFSRSSWGLFRDRRPELYK